MLGETKWLIAGVLAACALGATYVRVDAAVCGERAVRPCTVLLDNLRVRAWATDGAVADAAAHVGSPHRIVVSLPEADGDTAAPLAARARGRTTYVVPHDAAALDGLPATARRAVIIDVKAPSLPRRMEYAAAYPRPGARLIADAAHATIWEQRFVPGTPGRMRSYTHDTVIVWLSGGSVRVRGVYEPPVPRLVAPRAVDFVSAGAARLEEALQGASRAVIVEVK